MRGNGAPVEHPGRREHEGTAADRADATRPGPAAPDPHAQPAVRCGGGDARLVAADESTVSVRPHTTRPSGLVAIDRPEEVTMFVPQREASTTS